MNAEKKPRSPEEMWKAIEEQSALDEMDRIASMSQAEIDAELRAAGFDPAEVAREGSELAERLQARRARELEADARLRASQARLAARRARRVKRPRAELVALIAAAEKDPRLPMTARVHYRNHNEEEASDEHLADLLDILEDLIEEHEAEAKEKKGS